MMKLRRTTGAYGERVHLVEGFTVHKRLYIKKSAETYYLSTELNASLDTMVEVLGNYHYRTLKELRQALATAQFAYELQNI